MKTFLSLLSLLSLAGLLSITGCASENEQGGSSDSMESQHNQYTSPYHADDYWARDYKY
jgi:hypothetical protein